MALSGCATYRPSPLEQEKGASSVAKLVAPITGMPPLQAATHRFDPADGLDATEVAMLAVANSPDLRIRRDALGVARAQAFAAGLLPDPQIAAGRDFPVHPGAGLTSAYNLGLSEDLGALLTRSSRVAAAEGQADQVNLQLLWDEWQTVARARLLFDQILNLRAQLARLAAEQRAIAPVGRYINQALRAGNLTYDSASAGLNAGSDLAQRLSAATIALHQSEADLRVLLGLAPSAPLLLTGEPYRPDPSAAQLENALGDLPRRRPDLLALQAGYRAQEARLRGAILAQFPALVLGFNRARDTSAITTNGFTLGLTLPLFDRNRGNIAIETATRQQLHDDYAARLLSTRADMQRLHADLDTLDIQQRELAVHARTLDEARDAAERAWSGGLLDWPTYLAIRASALAADLDLLAVRQEQARQAIALQALLGNTDLATAPPATEATTP
jgi:outer membrane protein TolC